MTNNLPEIIVDSLENLEFELMTLSELISSMTIVDQITFPLEMREFLN